MIFTAALTKRIFWELRTSLRAIQSRSENATSQNPALREHRKRITLRHGYVVLLCSVFELYSHDMLCYPQHKKNNNWLKIDFIDSDGLEKKGTPFSGQI